MKELLVQNALHDFSVLRRRIRKHTRGTNDAYSILNIIIGIQNVFDEDLILELMNTRLNMDERKIYKASLRYAKRDVYGGDYDREFLRKLEEEFSAIRFG